MGKEKNPVFYLSDSTHLRKKNNHHLLEKGTEYFAGSVSHSRVPRAGAAGGD